jgi:hypothetical protein
MVTLRGVLGTTSASIWESKPCCQAQSTTKIERASNAISQAQKNSKQSIGN